MKKGLLWCIVLGVSLFLTASMSFGYFVGYDRTGSIFSTDEIANYDTTGHTMTNMSVTVYSNEGVEEVAWTNSGATGASDEWSLKLNFPTESTYNFDNSSTITANPWVLDVDDASTLKIEKLVLHGIPGDTVFDTEWARTTGSTPGSVEGIPFFTSPSGATSSDINFNVLYSDRVALTGSSPVGDLFASMTISFIDDNDYDYFSSSSTLSFRADTDNVTTRLNPVPEPSTLVLMGLGIFALMGRKSRELKNRIK